MKENDYHSLITLLFETDKFINESTDTFNFNHPIFIQYILPTKKKILTSFTSSNSKKSKLKLIRNNPGYKCLKKRMKKKQKSVFKKKINWHRDYSKDFLNDLTSNSKSVFWTLLSW